jgi:uncharacterized protein (DUF2252 family)
LIFEVNDLDETLPAPWEWDVKRLAASFVLAARANGLTDSAGSDAAVACAHSYRRTVGEFSEVDVLETWYSRLDEDAYLAMLPKSQRAVVKKASSLFGVGRNVLTLLVYSTLPIW